MSLKRIRLVTRLRWFGRLVSVALTLASAALVPLCHAEMGEKRVVHLYFADANKPFLVGEPRVMVDTGDPLTFGRQLVRELITGPTNDNLATIPKGTQLRALFLLDDKTAVVDFSHHFLENHPGSCRLEQLTLFSVVNSLALNIAEIERVKLLVNGVESQTLAGHVPLEFPLTADLLLTR
ncbi:MAG: GerMN domain-containing protein [Desulfosarcina sp.]|jgi:spore germination protein GerM